MAAKIIVIANQKGGAGKTTVSMQLAGTIGKSKKVLVVDADPQGTATRWASTADDNKPFPAAVIGLSVAGKMLHREIKKFIPDYDFIIVDCPPAADSPIAQSALLVADLAIVPIIPSPLDLWASVGIRQIIEDVAEINDTLKSRLLINQCQTNINLTKEVVDILPQFGTKTLKNRLHQRTTYRQSALVGGTVHDLGYRAKPAIKEINSLTREVLKLLKD